MRNLIAVLCVVMAVALVATVWTQPVIGSDATDRTFDRGIAHVESSSSWMDISEADYTAYQALVTIEPEDGTALQDFKITLDLDTGDDSDGFVEGHSASETVQFAVARKIQGKWRVDDEVESTAVGEDAGADRSVTLDLGIITSTEDARIYVRVSAEGADAEFAYIASYRGPGAATFTNVSN